MASSTTRKLTKTKTNARHTGRPERMRSVRGSGKIKLTKFISPMLATLHDAAFNDDKWIFEVKWDGYRAVSEISDGEVKLSSRNGLSFLPLYPRVAKALGSLGLDAILDGEIVVLNQKGKPDFQKLQQYGEDPKLPILYYVFDCLSYKGKSITHLPLIERKRILKEMLPENDIIRFSDHVEKDGITCFRQAVSMDLEGVIAKRADSIYQPGKRSRDWLKIKNHNTQEAIIAGYTQPKGSRNHIGALILAIKQNDGLRYIGHTGTGFTNALLKDLHKKFQPLIRDKSPFDYKIPVRTGVTWLEPKLVCSVKFTELTADGILRHPVFLGLRIDKGANETTTIDTPAKNEAVKEKRTRSKVTETENVKVTNETKLYWPEEGITKGDLVKYYQQVSEYILPYLKDRPQSLRRNPNGIKDDGFFQKEAGSSIPPWLKTKKLRAESAKRDINYIICNDEATLTYLNNLGCIELNPWNSRIQSLNNPDYLVIDLDPSDKNTFEQIIETARVVYEIMNKAGAPSYCKTSGASGLHIYVPMQARYTYEEVRVFAELIATLTEQQLPKITTTERSLDNRKGRIYLDYLQNKKGQTLASVYSVRPRPGATVSTPLEWKEVKKGLHPSDFTIANILQRIKKKGDLFSGVLSEKTDLKKCLKNLGA